MTSVVIHLGRARFAVEGEKLIHQRNGTYRRSILSVEFYGIYKAPSGMSPARCVHHLRPPDVALVGDVIIGLQNSLELTQKPRRAFAAAAHAKIEDSRTARGPVLP